MFLLKFKVVNWFPIQLMDINSVFLLNSKAVNWFFEQSSTSSPIKCSIPLRFAIFFSFTLISLTATNSYCDKALSWLVSNVFTYSLKFGSGKLVSFMIIFQIAFTVIFELTLIPAPS